MNYKLYNLTCVLKVTKSRLFTLKFVIVCLTNSLFNRTRKSAFKTRHTLQFNNVIRLLFQKKGRYIFEGLF